MGKEQSASYYDAIYSKSKEYEKPWYESRYMRVWQRMAQKFDPDKMVIDLGCGVGQTAGFLYSEGFTDYVGVDFSKEAIELAKGRFKNIKHYKFYCCDIVGYLTDCDSHEIVPENNPEKKQFFCSETLEHISDDTGLLRLLAGKFPASRIAISVPTFDDPSHVRVFKSVTDAKERYKPFIDIDDSSQIGPWIILQGKLANQL